MDGMTAKGRQAFRLYGQGYSYREMVALDVGFPSIDNVNWHLRSAARALGHDDLNARALLKVAIESYVQSRIDEKLADIRNAP